MGEKWKTVDRDLGGLLASGKAHEVFRLLEDSVPPRQAELSTGGGVADELEFLYRATQLAAQYDRGNRPLRWVDEHRSRLAPSRADDWNSLVGLEAPTTR